MLWRVSAGNAFIVPKITGFFDFVAIFFLFFLDEKLISAEIKDKLIATRISTF